MSIMHHWRGVETRVSLLRRTGQIASSTSKRRIIVRFGSPSSLYGSLERLCMSYIGSSLTLKTLSSAEGCAFKSGLLKDLVRKYLAAEVSRVK